MQSSTKSVIVHSCSRTKGALTSLRMDVLVGVFILVIGMFYLATIRHGHNWGDDFSLYIHHAKNIVKGKNYADTGYIYNPSWPGYSPRTYPPVFPLLLTPVYALYGLNLSAMKVVGIAFFVAALGLIHLLFRRHLTTPFLIALIALLGLNPFVWDIKDNIGSEMPFIFFLYLSFYLVERAYRSSKTTGIGTGYAIAVGLSIYLAYGTRTLGMLLLPCLLIHDFLHFRRISLFAIKVTILFLICLSVQKLFVQGEGSYFDQFVDDPGIVLYNISEYRRAFTMLWLGPYPRIVRTPLFVLFALLALFGYATQLRRRCTILELLPIPYLAIIMVWPSYQGNRFLLPLFPLYLFYTFVGIRSLGAVRLTRLEPYVLAFLTAMTLGAYLLQVPEQEYPSISRGITLPEAVGLFEYIRTETLPSDVIIFQKPRVLSLYTGRPSAVYHISDDDQEVWGFIQSINAKYIIVSKRVFFRDRDFFQGFLARHQGKLQQVYANAEFTVYRIKGAGFSRDTNLTALALRSSMRSG